MQWQKRKNERKTQWERASEFQELAHANTRCSLNSIKNAIIHTWYMVYMLSTTAHQIEKKPIKYKYD